MRRPLARPLIYARRCAGLWPAFRSTRSGLRSGARASGPPFVVHVQGYTQVRGPLARLSLCTRRVTLRCASLWLAFRSTRSGAPASGPPFDLHAQVRQPLARLFNVHAQGYTQVRGPPARLSIYALRYASLWPAFRSARSGARASGPPFVVQAQGYTQVRGPLARPLIYARRCAGL